MKNLLNKILISIYFSILFTMLSCEKDIYYDQLKKEEKSSVSFNQFLSETRIKTFKKQIKIKNQLKGNSSVKFLGIETSYIIDTTIVMKYMDANFNEKYSFKITPINQILDPKELYNLVYNKEDDVWEYQIYLLTKTDIMTEEERYETLQKLYDSKNPSVTTTSLLCFNEIYHCTQTGDCATNGVCDECLLCITPIIEACNTPQWGIGYSIQYNFIANDGPSGGGSSELTEPCTSLRTLANPNKGNIKPYIDVLKEQVNSGNNNKEIGVEFQKNVNPNTTSDDDYWIYTNIPVNSGTQYEVVLNLGESIYGAAHSHPEDGHDMFSFADVRNLMIAYNNVWPTRLSDVVYMLVCKDNYTGVVHTYAIKVDDIDKLNNQVQNKMDNPDHEGLTEKERLDKIHKNQATIYDANKTNLEKSFLQQFGAYGISLYKTDDENLSVWEKLDLASTTNIGTGNQLNVISTPCN